MTDQTGLRRTLDYYPILALVGFWFFGGFISSLRTGVPHLVALGVVTIPALAACGIAVRRIRARHREEDLTSGR